MPTTVRHEEQQVVRVGLCVDCFTALRRTLTTTGPTATKVTLYRACEPEPIGELLSKQS